MYQNKKLAIKIINKLKLHYPNPKTALNYSNPFELLVATILSAQCTDERVNLVTSKLFKKYSTIKAFVNAKPLELEKEVKSCGFYKNKAKSIIESSKIIEKYFSGKVPDTMEDLLKLRGVARKTANIILSSCFKKAEGIAVDTHVARLAKRFLFSLQANPDKIEQDLMEIFPKKDWILANYILVEHGRNICKSVNPQCGECFLNKICLSFKPILQKRPIVTIKYAQSLDGKIASKTGKPRWISNDKARIFAHELRRDNDAILVGINTVLKDDPMLNVREVRGKDPIRIILDSHLRIPLTSKIVKTAKHIKTIIFTVSQNKEKIKNLKAKNIEIVSFAQTINITEVLKVLYKNKVDRLLVEGGGQIISSFVNTKVVDFMFIILAPILIGNDGVAAIDALSKALQPELVDYICLDDNIVLELVL